MVGLKDVIRILCGASSIAMFLVSMSTAAFDAQYTDKPTVGLIADWENDTWNVFNGFSNL